MLNAPQDHDSDSDLANGGDDEDDDDGATTDGQSDVASTHTSFYESDVSSVAPPPRRSRIPARGTGVTTVIESTPLLLGTATSSRLADRLRRRKRALAFRSLRNLLVTFFLLSLAGFILSRATLDLAAGFHLSDTVLGLTLLSFATTLPEKILSVMAGLKSGKPPPQQQQQPPPQSAHLTSRSTLYPTTDDPSDRINSGSGVLMAGAAGSNIFLLSLCLGISFLFEPATSSDHNHNRHLSPSQSVIHALSVSASSIRWQELVLLVVASFSLVLVAYTGGYRWQGVVLFLAYIGFLLAEFTIWSQ